MNFSKIARSFTLIFACLFVTVLSTPKVHAIAASETSLPTNSVTIHDLTDNVELSTSKNLQLEVGHHYEVRTYFSNTSTDITMTEVYFRANQHIFFAFTPCATQSYDGAFYANGLKTVAQNITVQAPDSEIWVLTSFTLHYDGKSSQVPEGRVIAKGAPLFVGVDEPNDTQTGGQIAPNISGYVALCLEVRSAPDSANRSNHAEATSSIQTIKPDNRPKSSVDDHDPTNASPNAHIATPHSKDDEPRPRAQQINPIADPNPTQTPSKSSSDCEDAAMTVIFLGLYALSIYALFKSLSGKE